jgi:tRNA dimethylallyltransferase
MRASRAGGETSGREPLIVLLGPTASGKTDAALVAAPRLDAEIVSADSRQVYRGMDIGTAKPTAEEQARVPHHLLDRIDPSESYAAGRFRDEALAAIGEIRSRGKRAMVVGGTGLYLDALLRGLARAPARNDAVRAGLEAMIAREGTASLHARLAVVDPASSARIHANDAVRLIRALEIHEVTGRRPSDFRRWEGGVADAIVVGIAWERGALYERIEERARGMMRAGLLDEVRRLHAAGHDEGSPGMRTPGYRELLRHLAGRLSLEEAVALTTRATRRLARRQIQWFRGKAGVIWVSGDRGAETVGGEVAGLFQARRSGGCGT